MKMRNIKVEVVEAATAAALQADITTFIASAAERTFVDIQYQLSADATTHAALIIYSE